MVTVRTEGALSKKTEQVAFPDRETPMIEQIDESQFPTAVLQSPRPVMVDFGAVWCGPCIAMDPIVDAAANALAGRVAVYKVDVDLNPELAARYNVRSMPTFILFKDGHAVDSKVGAGLPRSAMVKWLEAQT
jgi:thioredoxin 1